MVSHFHVGDRERLARPVRLKARRKKECVLGIVVLEDVESPPKDDLPSRIGFDDAVMKIVRKGIREIDARFCDRLLDLGQIPFLGLRRHVIGARLKLHTHRNAFFAETKHRLQKLHQIPGLMECPNIRIDDQNLRRAANVLAKQ